MKIVVLDGHALNPGDLSWDGLKQLGTCVFYDQTSQDQVVSRMQGAAVAIINKVVFDKELLSALPELRYIGITATGYNIVDVEAAKAHNITVTNVPGYGTDSVAQAALALLLELTNHVGYLSQSVHAGKWQASKEFCYWDKPLIALDGLTMGIVGLGNIGLRVAHLASAFGMKIIAHTRTPRSTPLPIKYCGLDELFIQADAISLHCPLTPATEKIVNAKRLALMKPTAYLLNTSRGALIDEAALAAALQEGRIAGAGLDVLTVEPPRDSNPLIGAKNSLITPHISWATVTARKRLLAEVVANLHAFQIGHSLNVVNL